MNIEASEQNYKLACALATVEDAVRQLNEANIAVHGVCIKNNLPAIETDDASGFEDAIPLDHIELAEGKLSRRVLLCGCVVKFITPASEGSKEQAA